MEPPYIPPPGNKVALTFFGDVSYTPPPGHQAGLEFVQGGEAPDQPAQYVFAYGVDAAVLGEPLARLEWRPVSPSGFESAAYGSATAYNSDQYLQPTGFSRAILFGTLNIRNLNRTVAAGTLGNVARYGSANVKNYNQGVNPVGLQALIAGKPQIRNSLQIVRLTTGVAPRNGYGDARIWNNNPEAYLTGFDSAAYGQPAVWNSLQFVRAGSVPARLIFGLPSLINRNRFVSVHGIARSTGYGKPDIYNRNRTVRPASAGSFAELGATAIWNKTQTIWTAPAARGASYGAPTIFNLNREFEAGSVGDSLSVSVPIIFNRNRFVAPIALDAYGASSPRIWNRNQWAYTSAIPPRVFFGAPEIWNRNKFTRPSGWASEQYGRPALTHQHRTVTVRPSPYPPEISEEHGVSTSPHYVEPAPLNSLGMGWAGRVYSNKQEIYAYGFDAVEWGKRIIPENREIELAGWNSLAFALPQNVYTTTHSIKPVSFATHEQPWLRWGTHTVWNTRQYIRHQYDVDSDLNGEKWPLWTKIENRNKVLQTYGTNELRVNRPEIWLKSRVLSPAGIKAIEWPEFYKAGSVTHWLQRIQPEGLYGLMGTWMVVYYGQGHVMPPTASTGAVVPEPKIETTRRYYRWIGRIDGADYGHPFVAFGLRTIKCEARFGLEPPIMRMPVVFNSDQHVAPTGTDMQAFGRANLHIYWMTFRPRWSAEHEFGAAQIHNVTPEVVTAGRSFERYGRPSVRLQWRPVKQVWSDSYAMFGRQLIGYRTRTIQPSTADYLRFGIIADIEGGRSVLPIQKTLLPLGVSPPSMPSPRTNVWQIRVLYAAADGHRFGYANVAANSIYPASIQWRRYIGEPRVWDGYTPPPAGGGGTVIPPTGDMGEYDDAYVPPPAITDRRISGAGNIGTQNMGQATNSYRTRVSPHTIYAPEGDEATSQARINHPTGDTPRSINGMAVGVPSISDWTRTVEMRGAHFPTSFGAARVQLWIRYVRPSGWHHGRQGWQWVKGGQQWLEQYDSPGPSTDNRRWMGEPSVRDPYEPPPPPPQLTGFSTMRFGNTDNTHPNRNDPRARLRVELFNRTLPVTGWDSMVMGKDSYRNEPNSYYVDPYRYPHRLTVYFPRPAPMSGFDAQRHGTPWVSFRVRDMGVRGFDPLMMDYDNDFFDGRMRVIREVFDLPPDPEPPVIPQPPEQYLVLRGIEAFEPPLINVRPAAHYIRPDGNSDQYRKGVPQ